jgi:hypothetical protein
MKIFFWSSGTILFGFFACARTMVTSEPAPVPVVFQSMFHSCEQSDGEALLRVIDVDAAEFSATVVWNFKPERLADIQVNSPLGDTLLEIHRKGRSWTRTGQGDFDIKESHSRVVSVGGYELPLQSDELSCVLAGFWPSHWLTTLRISEHRGKFLRMIGRDDQRDIDVSLTLTTAGASSQSGDIKSCAVLKWGGFLGFFRNEGSLCRDRMTDGVVMRLEGIGRYRVEWMIKDET